MTLATLLQRKPVRTIATVSLEREENAAQIEQLTAKRDALVNERAALQAAERNPMTTWRNDKINYELVEVRIDLERAETLDAALKYEMNKLEEPAARAEEREAVKRANAATTEVKKALNAMFATIAKQAGAAVALQEAANEAHRRAETLAGETTISRACGFDHATLMALRGLWIVGSETPMEFHRRTLGGIPLGDWQVAGG